jgi:hypothetical protein
MVETKITKCQNYISDTGFEKNRALMKYYR